jgi:hypothetical protein
MTSTRCGLSVGLKEVAEDDPATIVRAIVALMPKDVNVNNSPSFLDDASEDELFELLQALRAERARIVQLESENDQRSRTEA